VGKPHIIGLILAQIILGDLLDIKSFPSDKVGVTAIQPVSLYLGLIIEFEVEVDNTNNFSLDFDWYPGEETRPFYWLEPFYLEISSKEVIVHYLQNGSEVSCSIFLEDAGMKLYRIVFLTDWNVKMLIDDGELGEACSVTIDPPSKLTGRITLSGWGLVDSVMVFER
jgi:hypothetical protein